MVAIIDPVTDKSPWIWVLLLTVNPVDEIDAVAFPLAICDRFRPVTPDAGRLYKLPPSPLNEPVNREAVIEPETEAIEP